MITRLDLERREAKVLAPYAMLSRDTRGRQQQEGPDSRRTAFQRDRDRIIHCKAFRRLADKTQVWTQPRSDLYRNRLTHTLEVAQIGRSMARSLGCNEDLTEAICLAHDLGHPPFGHTGEETLNQLMQDVGGFHHQTFTYRLVTDLERRRPGREGLNLTYEVREGILKHDPGFRSEDVVGYDPQERATLESQLANLADEIAYCCSDADDYLRSGLGRLERESFHGMGQLEFFRRLIEFREDLADLEGDRLLQSEERRPLISAMVTYMINDCLQETWNNLREASVESVAGVRAQSRNMADHSEGLKSSLLAFRSYMFECYYGHQTVRELFESGIVTLKSVFRVLLDSAEERERRGLYPQPGQELEKIVGEYLAGMTERFLYETALSTGAVRP